MATYEKMKLSASTTGTPITLAPAAGTTVHTTGTSLTVLDEVWLYVSSAETTTGSIDLIINGVVNTYLLQIPMSTNMKLIIPGLVFSGNGTTGTTISIYENNGLSNTRISGYINRITP